jgi:hypothetical protein
MGKLSGSRHVSGRKKEGMCPDWGKCCTFIPNNIASDKTITKALQSELAKNSEQWFGKWKGVMTSILTYLIVVFVTKALTGCCVIPCLLRLIFRLIETALTKLL